MGILWYNKDEDGKYIGFSDGVYDPEYDENTYLDKIAVDENLAQQQGKDVPNDAPGLTLAADLDKAERLLNKISVAVTKDIYQNIRSFYDRIDEIFISDEESIKNLET
jgi:hypothetical protein